jgi:tetratricopeptide (TPR) repeat protein
MSSCIRAFTCGVWQCKAWLDASSAEIALGNYHKASLALKRAQHIVDIIPDKSCLRHIAANKGLVYRELHEFEQALDAFQLHLALTLQTGDKRQEGVAKGNIAQVLHLLERNEEALIWHQQHLDLAIETSDEAAQATICSNLGVCAAASNDLHLALT